MEESDNSKNIALGDTVVADENRAAIECLQAADSRTSKVDPNDIKKESRTVEYSPDCHIGPDAAPADLQKDIIAVNPSVTLDPLLFVRKTCFSKMTVEKVLTWQRSEIRDPLLRMESERDIESSLQMFRNLLSYMGDRKSSKSPVLHARKYIKLVLRGGDVLRDEAFLQVYKQLHGNKKKDSIMRGWKMMCTLSSCFVPKNHDIYLLILNFLFLSIKIPTNDANIVRHINFTFVRMLKTKDHERRHVPSDEELSHIENLTQIVVPVYFFNEAKKNFKIESYTTVRELKNELMNVLTLNTQRAIYYSLYEICFKASGTEERFIDDSEKVCDILSIWDSEINLDAKKGEGETKFRFYLKLLVYYPFEKDDIDTLSIIYHQTVYDVLSGKHPLEERKIISMGALQLVNQCGSDEDMAQKLLHDHVQKYVPTNKFNTLTEEEWREKIEAQYLKNNEIPKNEAKWKYLQELESLPTFQTQQFGGKYNAEKSGSNDDNIPDECIIGLKPEGIIILDRERNEIAFYKYDVMMNWGISRVQLIICISTSLNEIRRICFFTSQTKVIQTLIEVYCNMYIGKSITEIQDVVKCYDKKFEKIDNSRRRADLLFKDEGKAIDDTIIEGDGQVYSVGNKDGEDNRILPEKEDKEDEKEEKTE